jgi:hypothetical protein
MVPGEIEAGAPVLVMRSERVPNSLFAGMRGTYAGISRSARPGAPRVLVTFEKLGETVPFFEEEVLVIEAGRAEASS